MAEYSGLPFKLLARDFFLYTTYFPLYLNERDFFDPALYIQQAKTAVFEMSSVFSPYMRKYVYEKTKDVLLRTDEELLRFLVPKCLRIYNPQNPETLTVVMSFVHEFLLYHQMNRLCYRFHFTAYKCVDAVFNRFKTDQWMPEGWDALRHHVRKNLIKMRPDSSDQATIDRETLRKTKFQSDMVDLLKTLEDDENDGGFDLNDYESFLIAENDPGNDPEEEDDDPFTVDLTPNPDLLNQKAGGFDDLEMGIPISSLLPVPPYSKPEIFESLEEEDVSGTSREDSSEDSDGQNLVNSDMEPDPVRDAAEEGDTYDEEYESNIETRTCFSKFEIYTSVMMNEALGRYGSEAFKGKLLKRKCEYCGIKCYRFSYNLFEEQLGLAMVKRPRN